MMSNTEELQHGECCCCLDKGDHRELSKQYYLDKRPEIYEVLFKDTFGIVLKYPENAKLICDCCIVKLREATYFRSMVETSQQKLGECVTWISELVDVKKEPLEEFSVEFIKQEVEDPADRDNQLGMSGNIIEVQIDQPEESNPSADHTVKQERFADDEFEGSDKSDDPAAAANEENMESNSFDLATSSSGNIKKTRLIRVRSSTSTLEQLLSCGSNRRKRSYKHKVAEKTYSCDICEYKTARKCNLTGHMRTHTGEKPFSCEICQFRTATKSILNVHLRTHTGEKPFICDICEYRSATKGRLTIHVRSHTGEKPFTCDKCEFKTAIKGTLNIHLRTHTGEKPFSCDICQYRTRTRALLNLHLRTHTGEMPHSCKICDYKTAIKGRLNMHMRTHTGEKPFSCDICEFKTAIKGRLSLHLRTHSGEKPFICDICEFKTATRGSLNIHMRYHTGEKPFSCDKCPFTTATKARLNVHQRTHSGQLSEKHFSSDISDKT